MSCDPARWLPLCVQVEDALAERIASGALPAGHQLPSAESLVSEFNVSRTGLVEIRRGKGTFVAHPRITQELTELTGFVEDMRIHGRHATARVLDKKVVPASEAVARQLALPLETDVVQIFRVRPADGVPLSFDETYLPEELGQKVMGSPIFLIERTSYIEGPKPIDYEKLYYRGDPIKFVIRSSRHSRARP
jgi:GntR family transcriptional regulator